MKPIQAQEKTRQRYHDDAAINTVHRSSLLAPRLVGSHVDISFANHFLLKRGYGDIACRLTAIDAAGNRLASHTYPVTDPRVYVFELAELASDDVDNYLIEFFSSANLFYPFPAVVINHRNERSLNSVHSYNRMLNDPFEDDEINAAAVAEASIDVHVDARTDTFGLFTNGPLPTSEPIGVSLSWHDRTLEASVPSLSHRLGNTAVSIRDLFGDDAERPGAIVRFRQPVQRMFYGRMLAGLRDMSDGSIAANHSFYDCSDIAEYWPDGRPSTRVYPLLDGFAARVRLYPIFSPCTLNARVDLRDAKGRIVETIDCPPLRSPSGDVLDLPVSARSRADEAVSFSFSVWPDAGGTPRRINHQLIYEDPAGNSALAASVAISLKNPNAFRPPNARGLCWGQCAVGPDLTSRLGIVLDDPDAARESIELRLFSEDGEIYRHEHELVAGSSLVFDPAKLASESMGQRIRYLWYWATTPRADLAAYAVTRNRLSGHCSGEHSF